MIFDRLGRWIDRRRGKAVAIWHDPRYRIPVATLEASMGVELRRGDFAAWYLVDQSIVAPDDLRRPRRISYSALARVHTARHLESLSEAETLGRIYAANPTEIPVDEVMRSVRLGCGGTLEAMRAALAERAATVNFLGGFHHAAPDRASGMCPVNDIAVAISTLRREGFGGRVAIIDLDAHPPDGTAACLEGDGLTWIGSISGCDWGPLPRVDETVLGEGADDRIYLAALERLLGRMPRPALAFVLAGGDVLAGDRLGRLGLTLDGARRRDRAVAEALDGVASVWLPGGGYHRDAWRVLAGTVLVLSGRPEAVIPAGYDPLRARFTSVSAALGVEELQGDLGLTDEEIAESMGMAGPAHTRFLGFYSAEGIEYAFFRFGFLDYIRRLGYERLHVVVDRTSLGDRFRLMGWARGEEHLVIEVVAELRSRRSDPYLFIHWMTLRNPLARFTETYRALPGQDHPGLGLAREADELVARLAERLGITTIILRPAWYHTAHATRHHFRFIDPLLQGRLEALRRDLGHLPLADLTRRIADGKVLLDGAPFVWPAEEMAWWIDRCPLDRPIVEAERDRARFTLAET